MVLWSYGTVLRKLPIAQSRNVCLFDKTKNKEKQCSRIEKLPHVSYTKWDAKADNSQR
jgi:hypothetical protein